MWRILNIYGGPPRACGGCNRRDPEKKTQRTLKALKTSLFYRFYPFLTLFELSKKQTTSDPSPHHPIVLQMTLGCGVLGGLPPPQTPPLSQPGGLRMYSTPLNDLAGRPPYAVTVWGKTQNPEKRKNAANNKFFCFSTNRLQQILETLQRVGGILGCNLLAHSQELLS